MNIFILSLDPKEAARFHCNKHVVKMVVESAQIMCSALTINGISSDCYRSTHSHHPCVLWAAKSTGNFHWLYQLFIALCDEYNKRYGRIHKSYGVVLNSNAIQSYLKKSIEPMTSFVQAMPDEWKQRDDVVLAYRCFYIAEKSRFAKWSPRALPPAWWPFPEV